ncbi:MAG: ribonuclease D [Rhodospirillales bacterium]|nr:ribonuclease D [Alphaproteobacteria bacterium]MCB9986904.1 ribonuclease D [Rhodospirillales bacterium]USO08318.1 MAG: ribonuclease D [Rhodospirillales bacterium]
MAIHLHHGDLPDGLSFGPAIAVDTETLGLKPKRDRLCLVQISGGDGDAHLVKLGPDDYEDAKNLKAVLASPRLLKIFHFARFDIAVIQHYLGVRTTPVYCTKLAAKLTRTYTERNGLKELLRDLLQVEISKQQQTSDWGADTLSDEQLQYAANDVLHLHALKEKLDVLLKREERDRLAQECFDFLPTRAELDLLEWEDPDIFAH